MIRVEQVKEVNAEIVQAIQYLFPQLTQFSPIPDEEALQNIVKSQTTSLWIARNGDGEIIAMLSLAIYRTTTGIHAWIEDVVVDQKARRQGVADLLTQSAVEFAQQNGAKAVSLTSRPEREAANRLYQKLGFELVNTNLYRKNLL
jgi:ribosomal protein S18 acetylase RimI-like enzyme